MLAHPHRKIDLDELAKQLPDELRREDPGCEVISCQVVAQDKAPALETVVRTTRGPFSMTVIERRFRGDRFDYEVKYTVEIEAIRRAWFPSSARASTASASFPAKFPPSRRRRRETRENGRPRNVFFMGQIRENFSTAPNSRDEGRPDGRWRALRRAPEWGVPLSAGRERSDVSGIIQAKTDEAADLRRGDSGPDFSEATTRHFSSRRRTASEAGLLARQPEERLRCVSRNGGAGVAPCQCLQDLPRRWGADAFERRDRAERSQDLRAGGRFLAAAGRSRSRRNGTALSTLSDHEARCARGASSDARSDQRASSALTSGGSGGRRSARSETSQTRAVPSSPAVTIERPSGR